MCGRHKIRVAARPKALYAMDMQVATTQAREPEAFREPQAALDYHRIKKALLWMDAHQSEQPSLDELASVLGLSPHHVQRTFRRWAGLSPKQFLLF